LNTYSSLYSEICDYRNLELAFRKAKKRKSKKPDIIEFEKNLVDNLMILRNELSFHTYYPAPLKMFAVCDPKTRKIGKSEFRDRVVHHALVRVIEPVLDKTFIFDSFANRKGKGVHAALKRFDNFKRKASRNNTRSCFVLKADIRQYFDTVDHEILVKIISKRIKDARVIWLIRRILENHCAKQPGKGMPLGNLTSQFFANVYLNELDHFVKHTLRAKYYIRYVDDFIILHNSREVLETCKERIELFLETELKLELHLDKSRIIPVYKGVGLLGFRVFYYHRLVRKTNLRKFLRNLDRLYEKYNVGLIAEEDVFESVQGWFGYAMHANSYKLRRKLSEQVQEKF
jgi:retron-type reverse transcriptase